MYDMSFLHMCNFIVHRKNVKILSTGKKYMSTNQYVTAVSCLICISEHMCGATYRRYSYIA